MKLSTYPNRIKRAKIKNYSLLILLLVISQVNTQESLVGCFLVTDTNDTIAVMNHVDTWNDPWENCIPACHAADYKYAAIQFGLCTCRQSLNNTATLNSSLCQSIALSPLTYDYFNDSNRLNIFEYQNITEFKEAKNFKLELNLFKYSNIDIKTDAKFILIAADQKILQDWTSVDQFNSTILNFGYKSLVLSVSNSYISKSPQSMIFVNKVYDSLKSSKLVCHRFYCLDCLVRCDLITIGSSVSVYLSHNGTELVDRNFTTQDSELDSYGNYVPFFIKSPPVPQLKNPNYVSVKRTGIVRVIEFYYVPASNESVKLIFWAGKIEPNGEKKISKKSSPVELKTTGYVFVDFPFDEDFEVESYWTIGWECVESRYLNLVNEDLMRVFVSIPSVTSVFFRANKLGNQTVETFIEGDISLNQTIDVVNKLQKVEIIILDECASGKSCIFLAKIYPSTYIGIISYLWKLECPIISLSLSLQTQDPLLNYTFPADCECDVTLNVNNVVTFKNVSERIKVLTIIKPIKLFSESGMSKKISASVEGEKAMIRFTYEDGTQYNCDIDFGDDSTLQFSELSTIQWNNTIFEHIYRKAGWYNLSIVCENLLNKLSYSTAHFVEKKIKKIELNSNHTLTNTPFQLEFKIDGSNPVSDLKFNGVSVHNIQYDNYTGLVKSRFAGLPVNIYEIILRVENLVSSMEFRGWFQSGFPISRPTLRIQGQNTIFEFTSYVVYYVDVEKGSNINIKVFYGDEVDEENPTIDLQLSGVWTKPLVLNHTHTIPGTFRVRVLVSNFFNSFTMYQNVTILTNCFDLLPILENKPVINTPAGSLAFFRFSYLRHKAGADAFVKFWPGDAKNESHGPYPLGMNYHTNTTQNALFYSYIYDGNYNASFQVYNTISSANYSLEVQVVRSVFGLTLDTNKKYLNVNDSFEVYAYMIQATSDTKFDFEFLGKKITIPRLSKELKTPDSVKFDPVEAVGNYTVKVRAYDQYSEISATLLIQVQQPITDVTFVTTNFVVARSVNYYRVTSTMIAFELNYSGMPTNPFYTIDFDDGGVVENPKYLENQNSFLVHFYEHANIYNVNVTVMNKVSSVSRIAKVKILNEFIDFKCVPKWRAVDVAIAKEYEYSAVDGVYMVSFDYQLRLHCTWKNTPIETISLFDALSNATIIHISDPYSLTKIPDGLIIIITTNQLFDLFTNQSSLIHVNYSNTLFTGSIPLHIKPVPSVKISGIITNITAVQPDDRVMFSIQEPKLSEPSCALISISVNQGPDQFLFSTGTSIIECSKYFKSIIYSGPYTLTGNNSWIIETVLKDQGLITVKVILKNIVSESNSSITLPVTKVPCYPPQVTIASAAKLFYEPKNHFRSDLLSISASIIFNCNNQASYIKTWLLFKADPSTGNNLSDSISLENNPTNSYLELVIGAKWLKPGLYRFVLLVNTTTSSGISFVSDSFTFVKIVPSGMNVAAFGGGVSEVIIGTRQECIFKPAEHSTDYDNSSNMSELEFKFYCKVVDSLSDQGYPSSSLGQLTDLKSLGDSGEILDADKVCFKRSRDFSVYNNTLIIAKKALKFKENRIYRFLITTTLPYSEKVYSQEVDLIVKDINRMLSVQIGCSPAFTCFKFNEVLIINPNSQIIMDGQCKTDCGSYVVYTWQLYAAFKIGLKTIWSPIKVSENLIQDQHKNKLVLSPEFFSTYTNVSTEWKVELRINSETTRYGPLNGYSSLVIAVNQLPVNGSCSVWPINGIAMLTDFNVICSGWIDPDGEIERYEFYAAYIDAKVDISVGLGYNKLGLLKSLRLQRGVLKIWVRVKDMAGGSVDYTIDELILVELNDAFESTIMSWDSDVSFWFAGSTQNILKIATSIIQYLNSANSNYTLESLNSTSNITTRRIYLRSFVFQQLSEASISDMSSMKMWAGLLAEATSVSSEMTIDSSLIAVKACSNLVKALEDLVRKSAFDEVRDITMGVGSSVSSVVDSLNSIQKRTNSTSELLISSFNTANSLMDRLTGLLSMRLGLGQLVQVKASQMEMRVMKMSAENVEGNVSNEFEIPSFCEMAKDNCGSDRAVVVQAKVGTVAPGLDGSGTVGLSLMNEDNSLISVKNSTQFIAVKVPRPIGFKLPDFEVVNVGNISSNISNSSSDRVLLKGPFYMSAFRIEVPMSAIFVHISPMNLSLGYFFWINRGGLPYYNQTVKVYEKIEFFCPNNLRPDDENEAMFYQFFMNMSETNNFTGILGFGLREMSDDELTFNCFNLNRTHENIIEPAFREVVYFTADFRLRSFTANCLFYDETNNKWSSDGVEILEHTDNKYTHCVSTHLTSFGGGISGLTILPPTINFASVFAKADFMSNQTIYITLIVTTSLLILLCIFARYKDNLDKLTIGLAILPENNPDHNYFYELIVFTGSRPNSSTDSKISFILSGEKYDSGVRRLYDPERQAFRSGGVDSFIMSNEKPLNNLSYLRIWHDNSGKFNNASWFLRYVIVIDLQTKQKHYFLCEKWLAVEKQDGLIERLLPLSTEVQKTQLIRLVKKEAKEKFKDSHLWLSIFFKAKQSTFSRLDRTLCAFCLLYMSMVMNLAYYTVSSAPVEPGSALVIGPLIITFQQIIIGVMCNLFVMPPTILLMMLFSKSKRRFTQLQLLKKKLNENKVGLFVRSGVVDVIESSKKSNSLQRAQQDEEADKKKRPFLLPWWCKIIAYITSMVIIAICSFFMAMFGIKMGNDKTTQWLTSFASSIFSSVFLTQPIKIVIVTGLMVLLCRKSNDKNDLIYEGDDEEEMTVVKRDLIKFNVFTSSSTYHQRNNDGRMTAAELSTARKLRVREVLFWKLVREFCGLLVFFSILFQYSFSNRSSSEFAYQKHLRRMFAPRFESSRIMSYEGFWEWTCHDFLPIFHTQRAYNTNNFSLNDLTSNLIGYAQIRQNRVEKDSCEINSKIKSTIDFCLDEYSILKEDKQSYTYNWIKLNKTINQTSAVESAFQYISSDDLDSLPLAGKFTTYGGGGYVFNLTGSLQEQHTNIHKLKLQNWLDRRTRSIIIEFNVYNPNANLFAVCKLVIESLATGNFVKTVSIDVINLFGDKSAAKNGVYYAFIGLIFWSVFREAKKIYRLRLAYLKQFWSWVQWTIITTSLAAFAIWTYRTYFGQKLLESFGKNNGKGYISFRYLDFYNNTLSVLLAIAPALATIKFIKLLRFNKTVLLLTEAISTSVKNLAGVTVISFILFASFIQVFYLLLHTELHEFNTILNTATTCFQIVLGKFEITRISKISPILATSIYTLFNITVIMIVVNLIITTISSTFSKIKETAFKYLDGYEMNEYVRQKFNELWVDYKKGDLFSRSKRVNYQENPIISNCYVDSNMESFRNNAEKLVDKLSEYAYIYENSRGLYDLVDSGEKDKGNKKQTEFTRIPSTHSNYSVK